MVDSDMLLVVGIIIAAFAIPAAFSAFADGRPPRSASIALLVGAGLVMLAYMQHPGGYQPADVPTVFARVIARLRG